jgi:hypothetical protein
MNDDDYAEAARQAQADLDELEAAGIEPGSFEPLLQVDRDHYTDLELDEGGALKAELEPLSDDERQALTDLSQEERVALREADRG